VQAWEPEEGGQNSVDDYPEAVKVFEEQKASVSPASRSGI
jgi:hypothetical protein